MKAFKFLLVVAIMFTAAVSAEAKEKEKTVVFNATLHCGNCKAKVEKNLPYEKGVKDLKVDLETQTITVTFREDKNSVEGLQKAIEKLSIPVQGINNGDKKECCTKAKQGECTKDCSKAKEGECTKECEKKCCDKE